MIEATFVDGPAKGQVLRPQRAPIMLRVVQDGGGVWDLLDALEDVPTESETIHVYRMLGAGPAHVCNRGHGRSCYQLAQYVHVPDADGDALRETAAWRTWARRASYITHPRQGGASA